MEKKETVKYVLRIEPSLKKALEKDATEQGRSLNMHINHLLKIEMVRKSLNTVPITGLATGGAVNEHRKRGI